MGVTGCANQGAVSQVYYPAESWQTSTPEEQGMDSALLADMINAVKQDGKSVNSITIIRHGYKVNEAYFYPYQKGMMHALNSCTKSFVSALTGIAIGEGSIKSVDDRVIGYFPELNIANVDERKQKMKLSDLLSMTSGLDWKFYGDASTNEMKQSPNFTKYTLDLPMKEDPGVSFNYSNGALHVVAAMIQKATGKSPAAYAADKLKALGIKDMYWGMSPENVNRGDAGIFMYPDDMAKFGYLYLKRGNWRGQQLIPEKWIDESTQIHSKPDWSPLFTGYGYGWWITRSGGYTAMGNGANFIFVAPDLDMVVVFTSGIYENKDMFYPADLMEEYIIPAARSGVPLPANQTALASLQQAVDAAGKAPAPIPFSLPETAKTISGRPFQFQDGTTMAITFKEGSAEFIFELNDKIRLAAGLDGVYRIADTGNAFGTLPDHNHMGFKGSWLDANTFQITEANMEDAFVTTYEFHFENGNIEMKMHTNFNAGPSEGTSKATFVN